jgi:hypothetical protein
MTTTPTPCLNPAPGSPWFEIGAFLTVATPLARYVARGLTRRYVRRRSARRRVQARLQALATPA